VNRSTAKEMMDAPDNPRELLEDDLRNLRIINRYLGNHRSVLQGVKRIVEEQKLSHFSLLDVGTGSADIPVMIACWARRKNLAAELVAVDAEPVTLRAAVDQTAGHREIALVQGDGRALPFHSGSFDFVLSSQMLHHFSEEGIIHLLRDWSRVARRAIIVSDLIRHPVAYYGIGLLTRVFTRNVMTRSDAPLSVERSFTLREWRELFEQAAIGPFRIFPTFPFRQMTLFTLAERSPPSRQGVHSDILSVPSVTPAV
jgi:2-polyprenyl-3-methyl-5-hydroxy-6-metoxy-1,4-benzoquinol methylase